MADPLSLLRQYNVSKKKIVERGDYICFGEYCWPKNVKTNYLAYNSSREGPEKEYYTLDCLLYFLNNVQLQHPLYVRQAAGEKLPAVRRPDRKDLLAYLSGEANTSASIDRSAPLELPINLYDLQSKLGRDEVDRSSAHVNSAGDRISASVEAEISADAKKLELNNQQYLSEAKKQFSDRLDAPKIKKFDIGDATGQGTANSHGLNKGESFSATLSQEQIASLKAKRMAKKRSTIIDAENEFEKDVANASATGTASGSGTGSLSQGSTSLLFKLDADFTREIQSKERVWRNRSIILQSTGKNFAKSIFPIIQSIKVREEGSAPKKPHLGPGASIGGHHGPGHMPTIPGHPVQKIPITPMGTSGANSMPPPTAMTQQQYNRYDQERFNRTAPSNEFRIDTTGSYHGFNLKNVTEIGPSGNLVHDISTNGNSGLNHPSTPAISKVFSSISQSPMPSPHLGTPNMALKKRTSRTPIIIIPATTTSLITLSNSRAILQDLKYIDSNAGEVPRDGEILIQRRKLNETTPVPYKVIDNPVKLAPEDWDRVVAVFVQGPAWQFKGWPWNGNPVEIFSHIKAFHLKWDEMKLDSNVAKWNVQVIQLSRNKRHLDRANLLKFWSALDSFMTKNKQYLRF